MTLNSEPSVTIPFTEPFPDHAFSYLKAMSSSRRPPLDSKMLRGAERAFIVMIALVLAAATALVFESRNFSNGAGYRLMHTSIAVVLLLVLAHLFGGVDAARRAVRGVRRWSRSFESSAAVDPHPPDLPKSYELATSRERITAEILDRGIAAALALAVVLPTAAVPGHPLQHGLIGVILAAVELAMIFLALPVTVWATNGRSPAKAMMGIRITRANGTPITLSEALKRELLYKYMFSPFNHFIDISAMNRDPLRRSQHDLVAKTFVVKDRQAR
jgi:uncharacterized RDD family membrane protein YckC